MKKTHEQSERGSAALAVLLIIVLVVLAGVGYWVWHRHQSSTTAKVVSQSSSASSSSSHAAASLATACGNLALSKGSEDGTAGTIYWHAVITNNGNYACTLTGYPAAFMRDAHAVSVGAQSNPLYPVISVTLAAHGGKAHAVIGLPDAGAFSPGSVTCTEAASSSLRLFLPGLTSYIETSFGEAACDGFTVTAIQPGA